MYVFFIILNTNLIINPNKHLFHRKCEDEKKKKKIGFTFSKAILTLKVY